ncbi:MAG TPA: PhoPQ-activated pathogenicity-related family protein [Candidatus Limnocylindria bacterium]|nr:PhoPQ-activated pathogenicity-related family protein [Candidatus Limnocylindria bacterium]
MTKRPSLSRPGVLWVWMLLLSTAIAFRTSAAPRGNATALDRYVAKPDPAYAWHTVKNLKVGDTTVTQIDMTSQTWLTTNEVSPSTWRHWVNVIRPPGAKSTTALLIISGGNNRDPDPPAPSKELIAVANAVHSVVAEVRMIPNQPTMFANDGVQRVEDDLIAYTWDKYLRTGDERWPARLPMTKAAVRAMDTVTAFTKTPEGGGQAIESFVVAGASKRGWTTWTTAIVDSRVVGICPIVIDLLNIEPSFIHHYQAYGGYAEAVGDYVQHDIMSWQGTPQYKALMKIEEPFQYRDRLTLPKLMLNACGDQFFLPDSSQFYFGQLPGVKYLRYVPNADHSMRGSDAYDTLAAWHYLLLNHGHFPEFGWTNMPDGSIRVTTTDAPKEIKLWQAATPKDRDFRLEVAGRIWWPTRLEPESPGVYVARVSQPAKGYAAYMVELTYDVGAPTSLKVTTNVRVTPEAMPYPGPVPVKKH